MVEGGWPSLAGKLVRERNAVIVLVFEARVVLQDDYRLGILSFGISHINALANFDGLCSGALLNRDLAFGLLMGAEIPGYTLHRLCSERRG